MSLLEGGIVILYVVSREARQDDIFIYLAHAVFFAVTPPTEAAQAFAVRSTRSSATLESSIMSVHLIDEIASVLRLHRLHRIQQARNVRCYAHLLDSNGT